MPMVRVSNGGTSLNPQVITVTDLATVPTTPGKTYIVSKVSTSTPTISGGTIILSTQVYPTNTTVFQWIIVATGSTFTITNGSRTGDLGAIQLD